jgi:hypothetical protein
MPFVPDMMGLTTNQPKGRDMKPEPGQIAGRSLPGRLPATEPAASRVRERFSASSAPRWNRIAFILVLGGMLGGMPAAGLDCPDAASVSNLLTDGQAKLLAYGTSIDIANEIDDLINKLQREKPGISYADVTDILIAAYCPLVADQTSLSAAEKWRRMRAFDTLLQQQLSGIMPAGSLIIARVPLPPFVYSELRTQAASAGQAPSQLMTAILSRAAGK